MKKLIINTEVLKPALKKLSQAVPPKPVLPALSNIYLRARKGTVELFTTDLELTISYVCSCECQDEFEMLMPFNLVYDSISLLPTQPIEIQLTGKNKAVIIGEDGPLQLGALDNVEDYPKMPDIPKKNSIELDEKVMEWLDKAMASTAKDELRPALSKALLEIDPSGITIVSTDAHSLFRHTFPIDRLDYKEQILISPKIAKALEGLKSATLTWHARHVALKSEDLTIISTRSSDKFPDYKVVIPNHGPNLAVSREALLSALNRSVLINRQWVILRLEEGSETFFKVIAEDQDLDRKTEISVPCSYTGKPTDISFTPRVFKTMLQQISFSDIRLHIDGPMRAALITSEKDADYLGMIMPLTNQ